MMAYVQIEGNIIKEWPSCLWDFVYSAFMHSNASWRLCEVMWIHKYV